MSTTADRIRVLHVDDDPSVTDVTATYLEREDDRLSVQTATSAEEGLDNLDEDAVDCIVSDFDMPGTNGIEFLELVREEHPELPFILYTGKGSEEVASEAISAGVSDYLQKETGTSQYEVLANRVTNVVEQRRARAEVAETEQRLKTIAENTNDILWKFSADWDELLFVNSPYEDIWGRSIDELTEQPRAFLQGVHPADRDRVEAAMERLSAGETVDIEFRVNAEENFSRWVWVQGNPVHDAEGSVEKVVGFARDVTDRKEQSRRLRTLINNLPGIVYRCHNEPGWPMKFVKGDCESLTGYASSAIESGDVSWGDDLVHPADRERLWSTVQTAVEDGESFEVTYRIRTKSGSVRWMWEHGQPIEMSHREEVMLEGIITDITERKERERALELSETRYETVFRNTEDAIAWIEFEDDTPIVREANPAFTELFGSSDETVEGSDIDRLVTSPDRFEEARSITRRVQQGESISGEITRDTVDGPREFRWRAVPIENPETGEVESGYAVYTDITDQKEREQELEATISFLQRLYEIATDSALSTDEKINRLLDVGPEELDLPYGHLTRIEVDDEEGGTQTIIEASGNHELLQPGESCPLSQSYCQNTIETDGVFALADAAAAGWLGDPPYETFKLGCYIGSTVTVDDELFGTVFFAASEPRDEPFSEAERTFVRLISQLVSYELERDRKRRADQDLAQLFDAIPDLFYVTDSHGKLQRWNSRVTEVSGYSDSAIDGMAATEFIVPEDRDRVAEAIAETIETGTAIVKARLETADGEQIPYELTGTSLTDANGDVTGLVGIGRDITERKHRQRELERYETLVETVGDPLYMLDADGTIEMVNGAMAERLETDRDSIVGTHVSEYITDADYEQVTALIVELLDDPDRANATIEITAVTETGSTIPAELNLVALTDESGTYQGSVGAVRDISERKAREQKLSALHAVADELATCETVDAVCERTIEASQDILEFDLSVIDIESSDTLQTKAVSSDLSPTEFADMPVDEGIAGKTYRTGDSFLVDDVSTVDYADPQGPFASGISVPIGDHGVFQAVSERQEAFDESDLKLAELLISHTESALDRLKNERELQRRNERLEDFASVVSHDLRNPLNVAQGNLELLREENDSEELTAAANAIERSLALIDDVLTLAREGEVAAEREEISLATLIEGCWDNVDTAEATLHVETTQTLQADPSRLKRLLENLIRNAVEHGGESVTITVGDQERGFYVADDGPGIPPDERARVFEAGYSTASESTGFGLNIVQEIAKAHGWEVSVTDSEQGGARFEIDHGETATCE